jgi:thiamine-monophosphate kinase
MPRRDEFDLIADLFAPLARRHPAALNLADDAAVLPPPSDGQHIVVSVDTVVAGVHFLPDDPPDLVARKALRVNLSDMAAMGAEPVGVFLSVAVSSAEDDTWMDRFAVGLDHDLGEFRVGLMGGDTVSTPGPASFTVTILGQVPPGAYLSRAGGRVGDDLWVSGTLGDSALGLRILTGALTPPDKAASDVLCDRYRVPRPRVDLGLALRGVATAALDVSDGLAGDLRHLCRASGCGARIETARLPLSDAARYCIESDPALADLLLTGGDDYELLFSAPPERAALLGDIAERLTVPLTRIGCLEAGNGVTVLSGDGGSRPLESAGWRHGW